MTSPTFVGDRIRLIVLSVFILLLRYKMKNSGNRKKSGFAKFSWIITILLVSLAAFWGVTKAISYAKDKDKYSQRVLFELWTNMEYQVLYDNACELLKSRPISNYGLLYKGCAAYYLATAQTDTIQAQEYIDESIGALRLALNESKKDNIGQISYMLGKAYYQKNFLSSYHYYADLSVRYLTEAIENNYIPDDIHEYMGISYGMLNMTEESIAAFTDALFIRESQYLLFAIAEQYYKISDYQMAKQYFNRIINDNTDDVLVFKSRLMLAQLYTENSDFAAAENEYRLILASNPNYADAYFGLGELYEKQGEPIKARAEWRKALKVQVNHAPAQQKLAGG